MASCAGCKIPLMDFGAMTDDDQRLRDFLVAHHVIASVNFCDVCHQEYRIDWRTKLFRCDRQVTEKLYGGRKKVIKRHHFSRSLVAGTWFDKQKLSQATICRFCSLWLILPHPRTFTLMRELSIGKNSVIDWSSFCREVCQFWLEQRSEILGGQGSVVEIDEAKIGHRKYNRGRWVDGFWVFGGFERGSGRTFLVPVPSRDSDTLFSLIKTWIRPGTTIMSDCRRAYDCLPKAFSTEELITHKISSIPPLVHTPKTLNVYAETFEEAFPASDYHKNMWWDI